MARRASGASTPPIDPTQEWLHRPDVWAGLILGAGLAERTFSPSLMPRATAHQSLLAGVAGGLGYAMANGAYGLVARTGNDAADAALLAGATTVGVALSRLPRGEGPGADEGEDEPPWRPTVRSVGTGVALGSGAALLGVGLRAVPAHRRGPVGAAVTATALGLGARRVVQGIKAQQTAHPGDFPPPKPLPAVTQSVAVGAVLVALGQGFRKSISGIGSTLEVRLGVPRRAARWLGRGAAAAVWYGTGKALADNVVSGLRVYDKVIDAGFDRAPTSPYRSSGDGSPVPFARLGREGRRFVLNVPSTDEIEAVMGRPAVAEPIRVCVGYSAARSDEERIALAVAELHRTGAFDRQLLVVGSAAGNGYVNTLPLEVLDHVLLGDTAAVTVAYGRLPSFLTLHRVGQGGRVLRALLEQIQAALAERAPEDRPRVVVYGESLGSWAGQNAFLHHGLDILDRLGVERTLWAGTPYYSGWRREVVVDGDGAAGDGAVLEVEGPAPLLALDDDARARLRAVLVGHGNDPVRHISAGLLMRRPAWLADDRPADVPSTMEWQPVLTALQSLVDAVNATRPVPGQFRATGHEYSADLPDATLVAFGVPHPDPDTWDRLLAHLQAVDAGRVYVSPTLPEA